MAKYRPTIITGQDPSDFKRWEVPAMDETEAQTAAVDPPAATALTAAEIEALQGQAYKEGFSNGHQDGWARGHGEGLEAAQAEMRPMIERLRQILHCMAEPLDALDEEIEKSLVTLALAIARQVVHAELRAQPTQIVALVREALVLLPVSARPVRLYLHPDDARIVREALSEDSENARWTIVEDPTLTMGGCRVESDNSQIDAEVERRLDAVIGQVLGGEERD